MNQQKEVLVNTLYWVTPKNPAYAGQQILCKPIAGVGGHTLWKNLQSSHVEYVTPVSWSMA